MNLIRMAPAMCAAIAVLVIGTPGSSMGADDASLHAGSLPFRQTNGRVLVPSRIAQRAVNGMRDASLDTRQRLDLIALRGVAKIERLKSENTAPDQVKAAAAKIVDALNTRAATGLDRIATIASNALARLDGLSRTQPQQERIARVMLTASKNVSAVRDRNIEKINAAVE